MTFGEAVLKLRSERRISQRQLADELNVSFTSVNRWENGRTMPNKMTVLVITNTVPITGWTFLMMRGRTHELQADNRTNLHHDGISAV